METPDSPFDSGLKLPPLLKPGISSPFLSESLLLAHPSCSKNNRSQSFRSNTLKQEVLELQVDIGKIENLQSLRDFANYKHELRISFYQSGGSIGSVHTVPLANVSTDLAKPTLRFSINPGTFGDEKLFESKFLVRFPSFNLGLSILFEVVRIDETSGEFPEETSLYWTALMLFNNNGGLISTPKSELVLHKMAQKSPSTTHFHAGFFKLGKSSTSMLPTLFLSIASLDKKWRPETVSLPLYLLVPLKSLPLLALIRKCLKEESEISPLGMSSDPFLGFLWLWLDTPEKFCFIALLYYRERKKNKKTFKEMPIKKLKDFFLPVLAEVPPVYSHTATCSSPTRSPSGKEKSAQNHIIYTPFHSDECKTCLYSSSISPEEGFEE